MALTTTGPAGEAATQSLTAAAGFLILSYLIIGVVALGVSYYLDPEPDVDVILVEQDQVDPGALETIAICGVAWLAWPIILSDTLRQRRKKGS